MSQSCEHVWNEISRIKACLVVTTGGRPAEIRLSQAYVDASAKTVWLRFDRAVADGVRATAGSGLRLCFADPATGTFLLLAGHVVEDGEAVHATPEGESLVAVQPTVAEFWDDPRGDLVLAMTAGSGAEGVHGADRERRVRIDL